eukprot:g24088.t2
MNERKSLWTVHPKVIHLSPQDGSGCQLGVSVALDAPSLSHAHHGPRTRQRLRCAVEELEFLDFGTIFTTQTCSREVIIKNHGQFGRRLAWAKEKAAVSGITVFRVEPEASILDPKTAYRHRWTGVSACENRPRARPTNGRKLKDLHQGESETTRRLTTVQVVLGLQKLHGDFKTLEEAGISDDVEVQIVFQEVEPVTLADKNAYLGSMEELNSVIIPPWHEGMRPAAFQACRPISSITESLRLENNGPLEVRFTVQVQYPFSTDIEEGGIPPDGSQEILVDFDPGYKVDRKSGTVKQRMAIQYDEHPAVNMVDLVGKVVWPNIELDTHKIDFGTVLNDTSKKMEVGMNIEGLA